MANYENIQFQIIEAPRPNVKYKRIIYAGEYRNNLAPSSVIHGYRDPIIEDVVKEKLFPVLITWETPHGEEKFAEITKTK